MSQPVQEACVLETSNTAPFKDVNGSVDWQRLCQELTVELAKTKEECDQYKKAVLALTQLDFDINEKELLALVGTGPSLKRIIAQMECRGA